MVSLADVRAAFRLRKRLRYPDLRSRGRLERGICEVCGCTTEFRFKRIVPDEMAKTAELTPRIRAAWDRRESMACTECGSSYRTRQMARGLLTKYGGGCSTDLTQLVDVAEFRDLGLLVIDDPPLHAVLGAQPKYAFSDYMTSLIPAIRREDEGLAWADGTFDLVLSSDVLEHTPWYLRAVSEIARVLKPGGAWVACLPLMLERRTRTRATADERGTVRHLLPPSYHCRGELDSLVFVEFGADFIDQIEGMGLKVEIYFYSLLGDDYTPVFVSTKS